MVARRQPDRPDRLSRRPLEDPHDHANGEARSGARGTVTPGLLLGMAACASLMGRNKGSELRPWAVVSHRNRHTHKLPGAARRAPNASRTPFSPS
jgi:hypothetical protein